MGSIIKQLRQAADCAPLWRGIFEAAADEIERLQNTGLRYERLIENGLICGMCGGLGSVGSPPDDYYDCPDCATSYNKIKAEAVREAITHAAKTDNHHRTSYEAYEIMTGYANKLERGEL